MPQIEKNEMLELEILKHVEGSSLLNNRMAAAKLGCSVKLAHELLRKMVERGLLHIKKHHSRRWDYFLTPSGITEKARLTYEFIGFSMYFYHEARKESSKICRMISESGGKTVAFIGCGDLSEIVYLGVKEWNLELVEVYGDGRRNFLGLPVAPIHLVNDSKAEAIIVCLYDKNAPLARHYVPDEIKQSGKMFWIFEEKETQNNHAANLHDKP